MSRFEETTCKILGVMLFLIICLLVVQLNGCICYDASPPNNRIHGGSKNDKV
jgi:hypothetical protein